MTARKWSIAAAAFFTFAYLFLFLVSARPPLDQWRVTKVFIPKGSTYPEIEEILAEKGALRYPLAFRILVIGTMTGTKLQHGEYALPAPPSAIELWRKLVSGDVAKYQVTIPGGSTLSDIAKTLGTLELANPSEFLTAAVSPTLTSRMGIPGNTLEGYLFPDTYIMVKDMSSEEILGVMVRRFRRKFTPEMESMAEKDGFTLHQIVTIASIIEKEAGLDQEKPLVSEVIRKRLSINMPLQMDPTVIYGLKKFGGNLTKKDLRTPNPYNTYRNRGLPPGPICNPGLSSLIAAVEPAGTDYLYFVSRNDGSHQFSRTLQEHNRAVAVYQKRKKTTMGQNEEPAGEIEAGQKVSTPLPRP
ncbi:MAG: endolytic transglycosylase MltG [Thermodesulfobacteriota bacterium]|nr:endolytic transglycosylase MltG [Thermodesulfobacteriota bacterium]